MKTALILILNVVVTFVYIVAAWVASIVLATMVMNGLRNLANYLQEQYGTRKQTIGKVISMGVAS